MRVHRLIGLVLAAVLLASVASAQTLTPAQLATLKANITASADLVQAGTVDCGAFVGVAVNAVPNTGDGNVCLSQVYKLAASPDFTVWKTNVPLGQVGRGFNTTELAGLTSLNTQRLQNLAAWLVLGVNPSLASDRAFFDDVFSGAGGTNTRAALLILWKRLANRGERVYATGTGSNAVPGLLVFEGTITASDIATARNLP